MKRVVVRHEPWYTLWYGRHEPWYTLWYGRLPHTVVHQGGYRTQWCIREALALRRLSPLEVYAREALALRSVCQGGYLPTMVYPAYPPWYIPPSHPGIYASLPPPGVHSAHCCDIPV